MKRQEILLLLMTFVTGVFVGVYAYFAGYSPAAQSVSESMEGLVDEITIVGQAYGGCDRSSACPSFQVAPDGSYRYFYQPGGATTQALREGVLPVAMRRDLLSVLDEPSLAVASQETAPALCESFVDGIDVRYTVSINETEYVLDSCGTAVDGEGELWQTLSGLWTYLETES